MLSEAQPDFMLYNYFSDIFYILKAKKKPLKQKILCYIIIKMPKKDIDHLTKGKAKGMCKKYLQMKLREN